MSPRVHARTSCSLIVQHRGQGGIDKGIVEQTFFEDQVATDKFPAGSSGNSSVRQQGSPGGVGFLGALVSPLGPRVSFLVVVLVFVLLMLIVLLLLSLSVAPATAIAATAAATINALEIDGFLRSQHVSTQYVQS